MRATAGRVPFVHVISGGFDEIGAEGAALSDDLLAAACEVKTRVIGPNCIGVFSPAGRQAFQLNAPREIGGVSIVSQSGGLSGDFINGGTHRGLRFSKVLSVGNAIYVSPAEVLDWLVDDPDTTVIGLYLEGGRWGGSPARGRCVAARGQKPVVLLVGGQSAEGAEAVVFAHRRRSPASAAVWEAIARSTGVALVRTVEEFPASLSYLQRWRGIGTPGGDVLVVGVGGGASVMAADAV